MKKRVHLIFSGEVTGGRAYGDLYEPTMFGSAGGGDGGGRGGGRIWLNVTDTIQIDGIVSANGGNGETILGKLGGGGSGGSIWIHCNRVTGFGKIQAAGGNGSFGDIDVVALVSTDGLETMRCETQRKCANGVCHDETTCTKTVCDQTGALANCVDTTISSLPMNEFRCYDTPNGRECSNLCNDNTKCDYSGSSCATKEVCCSADFSKCCYDSIDTFKNYQNNAWYTKHICCHEDSSKQFGEVCCHNGTVWDSYYGWTTKEICCYPTEDCNTQTCYRYQTCCVTGGSCYGRETIASWPAPTTTTTVSYTAANGTVFNVTTPAPTTTTSTTTIPTTTTAAQLPRTWSYITETEESSGGGGGGGRIAMYFHENTTFSEFRYLANGGWPGRACEDGEECEAGGPGTAFLYHMVEEHRTLIIDNDGAPSPKDKYVNWANLNEDGGRAWILPVSGSHTFAQGTTGGYAYEFEELQIYGNAHLAVEPPTTVNVGGAGNLNQNLQGGVSIADYDVIIFFKYMIGDRTGSMHVADKQAMDLLTNMQREEMDLPFNTYTYQGSYLGLAPMTFVHGVEIHLAGYLANVNNITLRLGGYVWLKHGGHTTQEIESSYKFDYVKVQDDSTLNATTDPIDEEGITFYVQGLTIEGGGVMHGSFLTVNAENVTVDAGGHLSADGLGYRFEHDDATHGASSLHGTVNPGAPDATNGIGGGGGHGGSGGKNDLVTSRAGFAYGDIYEPQKMGSSGGAGVAGVSGGSGGGRLWFNVTDTIFIDGLVSADGADAVNNGAGGGSGGSVWMHCNIIEGYGKITAHGGAGSNYSSSTGSGGAGGRVAVYFNINETMSEFRYWAYGGAKGGSRSENGGAGTVFIYHKMENHTTIILDNDGQHPRHEHNIIDDYADLTYDSCRTWILPESGYNTFAGGKFLFSFNELQIYGAAHLAVLPEPVNTPVDIFFLYMIGDRTGTMHVGDNQDMDLERPEIDLPFNCRVYAGGFIGLAPNTIVHSVTIWLHGEMDHVENLTLHHQGHLSLQTGGHTTGNSPDYFDYLWVRIQDNATISIITDPVADPQSVFRVANKISMEGAGNFYGTNMKIIATDITLDYGATIHADALGYRPEDPQTSTVNRGLGTTSTSGSSGGGYGGSSGKGTGTTLTGQPYGHLFQPYEIGSAGGGGHNVGGQGGGMIYIEVSGRLMIDGEVRSNGGNGKATSGGGGSGGTILIDTYEFRGMGNITANGGGRYTSGTGGGGAGGRIAIYLRQNVTYWGEYQCHGGYSTGSAEPGGPGLVFIYNVDENHSTLYVNNDNLQTTDDVNLIRDYTDLSQDRFKAWIMPTSSDHWLAGGNSDYRFNELQIYGNAHLALLPEPYTGGCNLHFKHMIGDRSGYIHIGPYQVMDLNRYFLDTPFSSYVYDGGYLGLAPETFLESVFVHVEGTVDHIHNLTLIQGGGLRLFKTGSTNSRPALNYVIEGMTVVKADSYINCSNPNADSDSYELVFGWVIVEGGGLVKGGNLHITATDFTIDDGGAVDVSNGGYMPGDGSGNTTLCVWFIYLHEYVYRKIKYKSISSVLLFAIMNIIFHVIDYERIMAKLLYLLPQVPVSGAYLARAELHTEVLEGVADVAAIPRAVCDVTVRTVTYTDLLNTDLVALSPMAEQVKRASLYIFSDLFETSIENVYFVLKWIQMFVLPYFNSRHHLFITKYVIQS